MVVLEATFSSSELKTRIVSLGSSATPDEGIAKAKALIVDVAVQVLLLILEASLMAAMLDRWGAGYADVDESDQLLVHLQVVIGVGNQRQYIWLVHTYCGLCFLFLLFTTTKMFGGAFEEWKDRLSTNRRSTTTKAGSTETEAESTNRFTDRFSAQRSGVNSAYSNENERIGDLFDEMFSEDNVVEKMIRRIELCDEYQEDCDSEDGDEERRR